MIKSSRRRNTISQSRLGAYLAACGAWVTGGDDVNAEIYYEQIDPALNYASEAPAPYTMDVENPGGILDGVEIAQWTFLSGMVNSTEYQGRVELNWGPSLGEISGGDINDFQFAGTGQQNVSSSSLGSPIYYNYLKNFLVGSNQTSVNAAAFSVNNILQQNSANASYSYNRLFLTDQGVATAESEFDSANGGYIGFRFKQASSDYYYGWFHVSDIDEANGFDDYTIDGWAIELEAGTGILAGDTGGFAGGGAGGGAAVPEPSSLTLLTLGLGGLAIYRRRLRLRNERISSADASDGFDGAEAPPSPVA